MFGIGFIMVVINIKETIGKRLQGGSLPDIDTDFPTSKRMQVKEYMDERFGETQVASVGTFTTLKLKGALKDLDRQLDNNVTLANLMTAIISEQDTSMLDLYTRAAKEPRLKEFIKRNSDIFHIMPTLLNQPKSKSIHSCAVIVAPHQLSIEEWAPMRTQKGLRVTEWSGYELDDAGFLKEDILGLAQLDKFQNILDLIKLNGKEVPDIYDLPQDPEVYRFFSNGWNGDVFQMGTDSLSAYTRYMKPNCLDDLTAVVALHRPGPMENHYHEIYVKCKNEGREQKFLWGTENITKNTFGLLVYQEQVMAVCQQIGGLTQMEADDVRRAMGKGKLKELVKWKEKVGQGFLDKGATQADFEEAWSVMLEFSKYCFNESHSAAYGQTGYICQWLKVNYPLEYWTVALANPKEEKILKFLSEIFAAKGIKIASPDINKSDITMTSDQESNTIFWGIESIKGIGEATAEQIIDIRKKDGPYKSFADFLNRNTFTGSKVKKQTYEALIASGAFDLLYDFKDNEQKRLSLIKRFRIHKKTKISNPATDIYTNGSIEERWWWLLQQKRLTGLVFIDYSEICEQYDIETQHCSLREINTKQYKGIYRSFGGYVLECKTRSSARGKFAILTVENNYRLHKVVIWSGEYERLKEELKTIEKKAIVFNAEIKYESKWVKDNQFTLQESSQLKVLG